MNAPLPHHRPVPLYWLLPLRRLPHPHRLLTPYWIPRKLGMILAFGMIKGVAARLCSPIRSWSYRALIRVKKRSTVGQTGHQQNYLRLP